MNPNDKCFCTCAYTPIGFKMSSHLKDRVVLKTLKSTIEEAKRRKSSSWDIKIGYFKDAELKKLLPINEAERILKLSQL